MPAPVLQSRWGIVVLLLSAAYGSTPKEQCTSLGVLYAVEGSNGVKIVSAMEGNKTYEIAQLRNYSLPSAECQPNFDNCKLQCFECDDDEENICCTLPVINETGDNHLALLQFRQQSDPPLQLQDQAVLFQDSDCVTAQIFFTGNPEELPVACINTKMNDKSYIWFLKLVYESTNISGTARYEFSEDFKFLHLTSPLSLSEFRSLEQSECHVPAIFFVANSAVYTISQQEDGFTFPEPLMSIPDCFLPLDVGFMYMDHLHLRLQCSEYIAKLFTACGSHEVVEIFDSRNKTVYQCVSKMGNRANITLQNDLLNVTVSGSPQEFEGIIPSQYFPFMENISYAFCNVERNVSFVFALRNGSVFSLSLTTGELFRLSHNSCNSSTNTYTRGQCYKTRNTTIPDIIGAYDFEESTFRIANLSCHNNPVVANIEMDSLPPLAAFVRLSKGVCRCPSSGNNPITSKGYLSMSEASLSPTISYTVSTTPVVNKSPTNEKMLTPTAVSTNKLNETLMPTAVSRPTANSKHSKGLWALTALTVLVFPVVLLFCCGKRIMKKCSKNTPKRKNRDVPLSRVPAQPHSGGALSPPPSSAPRPGANPKSKSPTNPDISQPIEPNKIVPQPPQATKQQDSSNLTYPSLDHYRTSNGTAHQPSLHQPSLPSGNPGRLDSVGTTANNNIQQESSGIGLLYPPGQEVIACCEQETQCPADNINAAFVPGTDPQRQAAPVVLVPQGQAAPQGQGAPRVPQGHQQPQSSSSPDPLTGEINRGH